MFVVSTVIYPLDKAVEISRAFIKSTETPLPSHTTRVHVLASATEQGMKVLGIYEIDDAQVPEGIKELTRRYAELFFGIEGFKYQLEPMLTAEEAIPLLGL